MGKVSGKIVLMGAGAALMLAGCTANQQVASSSAATSAYAAPGGSLHWGGSIASMADQYSRARPGPVPAAGASAWVPPSPPPAMVATNLPPAPAPAGPPAFAPPPSPAPAARPAVDAANIVRPEAAQDAPEAAPAPAATLSAATREAGRKLFTDYSCSTCHGLADAGASGSIGPSLDRNPRLSKDYVIATLTTGRGAMPSFAGQMSDAEMATLAEYVVGASRK